MWSVETDRMVLGPTHSKKLPKVLFWDSYYEPCPSPILWWIIGRRIYSIYHRIYPGILPRFLPICCSISLWITANSPYPNSVGSNDNVFCCCSCILSPGSQSSHLFDPTYATYHEWNSTYCQACVGSLPRFFGSNHFCFHS